MTKIRAGTEELGFDSRQLLQSFQCSTASAQALRPIQLWISEDPSKEIEPFHPTTEVKNA